MKEFGQDKDNEITEAERAWVLNRLIDEELLVQHGLEIGLVDSERAVREAISKAMTKMIVEKSIHRQPSEADLRTFYEDRYGTHNIFLFDRLREQVESAYIRFADEKALRDHLDWLWGEAEVTIAEEPPQ